MDSASPTFEIFLVASPGLEATVADYVRKGDFRIAFENPEIEAQVAPWRVAPWPRRRASVALPG